MANSEGKTIGQEQKRCFIIMPISDVDGYLKDISIESMSIL